MKKILLPLLLLFGLLQETAFSQPRVLVWLANRRAQGSVYKVDVMAQIPANRSWRVLGIAVAVNFNSNALNPSPYNGLSIENGDPTINAASTTQIEQYGASPNQVQVQYNNFFGPWNTVSNATITLGTLRFAITNASLLDSITIPIDGTNAIVDANDGTLFEYQGQEESFWYNSPTSFPVRAAGTASILSQTFATNSTISVCSGYSTTLSVNAISAGTPTYQWYFRPQSSTIATAISAATSSTYTISVVNFGDSGEYYCGVGSSSSATIPRVNSNRFMVYLSALPTSISISANQTKCVGETVTFLSSWLPTTATAEWGILDCQGQFSPLTQSSRFVVQSTSLSSQLTISNLTTQDAGIYCIRLSNQCTTAVVSTTVSLAMTTSVAFSSSLPTNATTVENSQFQLCATVGTMTYTTQCSPPIFTPCASGIQWQKFSTTLNQFVNIPSQTSACLSFSSVQLTDAGVFRVQALCGSCSTSAITSSTTALAVLQANLPATLNVKVYFQGNVFSQNGVLVHRKIPVLLELRTGSVLNSSVLSRVIPVQISSNGTVSATITDVISDSYWIVVRTNGCVPVAGSSPVTINPGSNIQLDFTVQANVFKRTGFNGNVLGSINLSPIGAVNIVRAGDLDQNRIINVSDFGLLQQNLNLTNPSDVPLIE